MASASQRSSHGRRLRRSKMGRASARSDRGLRGASLRGEPLGVLGLDLAARRTHPYSRKAAAADRNR